MFQKEVAERIVAKPKGRALRAARAVGAVAVRSEDCDDAATRGIHPAPKVHSAVVQLTALPEPRFPCDFSLLQRITAMSFNQRRKMLRSSLKGMGPGIEGLLESVGIDPDRPGRRDRAGGVLRAGPAGQALSARSGRPARPAN